ncbi:unnamed protein product [Periconia digitata]|uniref:Uncharacterized protein n=1 Tax=Periconia digitata TaxID=1303443 RepID=A0A9W4UUH4_9PLEO|nr:unnamed protein product [Periconia digitata]
MAIKGEQSGELIGLISSTKDPPTCASLCSLSQLSSMAPSPESRCCCCRPSIH